MSDSSQQQPIVWEDANRYLLQCPRCGFHYSHHGRVEEYQRVSKHGEDGPSIMLMPGSIVSEVTNRNPSDRRGAVRIHLWGECGHSWVLDVIQHKGQTYLNVTATDLKEEDVAPKSLGY